MEIKKPTVSIHGSGESVTLSNLDSEWVLMQGATGLGWGPQEITTAALPGGGSVIRHRRTAEAEVVIPLLLSELDASDRWEQRRKLERLCDGLVEIRVDQNDGDYRSRYGYYKDGLQGDYGAGEDSPDGQKLALTFLCPDPTWYGPKRQTVRALDGVRKPFLAKPVNDDATRRRNILTNPSFENGVWQPGLPDGASAGSSTAAVSSTWAALGTQSLKITPAASVSSARSVVGANSAAGAAQAMAALGVTAGRSYTFAATFHQDQPQTDTTDAKARTVEIRVRSTSAGIVSYNSAQAPNIAGTKRLSVTTTIPEDVTGITLFLWNGSSKSTEPVYWDQMVFEVGDTGGPYFDGSTAEDSSYRYEWEGAAHGSASVARPKVDWSPLFFPVILAPSTVEGAFTFTINGDAEAWPTWIVDGPGEDLLIENKKTGDRIFVSGRFDEQVTITTRPQVQDITSPSHMDGSLWDRVSIDSVLFPLAPGENEVAITMVGASAKTQVQMTYQEAWKAGY